MKNKEFEKLLGFVDRKDQNPQDFSGFREPDSAKGKLKELLFFRSHSSDSEKDFSPYFTDKVMQRVIQLSQRHGIEEYLSMLLSRVVTFGLTAAVLFFLTLYFFQGQDGIETILGTDRSNDINFISYLFYEI